MALKQFFNWITGDDSPEPEDREAQVSPAMRAVLERTKGLTPVSADQPSVADQTADAFFSEARGEIDRLQRELGKSGATFGNAMPSTRDILERSLPRLEETSTGFTLTLNVPGFTERDIKIEARDTALLVSAEHRSDRDEGGNAKRFSAHMVNAFRHTIKLDGPVDPASLTTTVANSVLRVTGRKK